MVEIGEYDQDLITLFLSGNYAFLKFFDNEFKDVLLITVSTYLFHRFIVEISVVGYVIPRSYFIKKFLNGEMKHVRNYSRHTRRTIGNGKPL